MATNAQKWEAVGGPKPAADAVFPRHLMNALYFDAGFHFLFLLSSIILGFDFTGPDGDGMTVWIWICIIFGVPWWGTSACGIAGVTVPLCRCCSPSATIVVSFALCITSGFVVLAVNFLGMITTEGGIGENILDSEHGPGIFFYLMWIPGTSIAGIVRMFLASMAFGQKDAVQAAENGGGGVVMPQATVAVVDNPVVSATVVDNPE